MTSPDVHSGDLGRSLAEGRERAKQFLVACRYPEEVTEELLTLLESKGRDLSREAFETAACRLCGAPRDWTCAGETLPEDVCRACGEERRRVTRRVNEAFERGRALAERELGAARVPRPPFEPLPPPSSEPLKDDGWLAMRSPLTNGEVERLRFEITELRALASAARAAYDAWNEGARGLTVPLLELGGALFTADWRRGA